MTISLKLKKRRCAMLTAVAISALTTAGPVFAQTTAEVEAENQGGVTDIVVTAQRREESLQKVPLSIVAIGRESLDNQNVTQASRLEQIAPGLSIGRSGADPRPAWG